MSDRDEVQANVQNAGQGGGQPQAQPQGQGSAAQAPAGQAPVAQESVVDKLRDPLVQDFAKGVSALYALVGVGIGLLVVVLGWFGSPALLTESQADAAEEIPEYGELMTQYFVNEIGYAVITILPVIAVASAVLVGLYAIRSIDADEQTTLLAAGTSAFGGSVLMVVPGSYLAGSQIESLGDLVEEAQTAFQEAENAPDVMSGQFTGFTGFSGSPDGYQVLTVDLVVNAVGVGLTAGVVAVATAYVYKNYLVDSL